MFEGFVERRIARDADRIVALKEEMDALSWGRVLEIGRRLQELALGEEAEGLAQELVGIALSNISLETKLGIEPKRAGLKTLASGMQVIEGGLAEASSGEASLSDNGSQPKEPLPDGDRAPDCDRMPDGNRPRDASPCSVGLSSERVESLPVEDLMFDFTGEFCDPFDEELESFFDDPDQPAETAVLSVLAEEKVPAAEGKEIAVNADPSVAAQASDEGQSSTKGDFEASEQAALKTVGQTASQAAPKEKFATFRSLYSSRDGALCLYEDESGHLVAVDSSKLV